MELTWQVYGFGLACTATGALLGSNFDIGGFGKWLQVAILVAGIIITLVPTP